MPELSGNHCIGASHNYIHRNIASLLPVTPEHINLVMCDHLCDRLYIRRFNNVPDGAGVDGDSLPIREE